jgi:hypothetical protein
LQIAKYLTALLSTLELVELAEVQNKAAVEQAFPGGWQSANIQVGVSNVTLQRPANSLTCSNTQTRRRDVSDVRDGLMINTGNFLDCNGKYLHKYAPFVNALLARGPGIPVYRAVIEYAKMYEKKTS